MISKIVPETRPVYSVVVPVYNSEHLLDELYQRLVTAMEVLKAPFEIVFVEDGSKDQSWQVLGKLADRDHRVTALQLMRNSGQGNATLAGLNDIKGDYVITLDDDLQNPPEEIQKLVKALLENDQLDAVIGVPAMKRHNLIRRFGSYLVNRINSLLLQKDPALQMTSFRVVRRQVVDAMLVLKIPYPVLGLMLISVTNRIKNVVVQHNSRKAGRSTYRIRQLFNQTVSNFIGYSVLPLHMLAFVGMIGIITSVLIGTFYIIRYFWVGIGVAGWTTLLLVLLALSGFNFFAFAILGEYVLKLTQISSNTTRWVIRKRINRSQEIEVPDLLERQDDKS